MLIELVDFMDYLRSRMICVLGLLVWSEKGGSIYLVVCILLLVKEYFMRY